MGKRKGQEHKYFMALSKDREENAKILEKRSMRGVKNSVVEKYSDQAHFIYELLQNADDAGATRAAFDLRAEMLVFSHNGTRRFTVTNPGCEDADSEIGKLGDINAITSIANSNKTESSIGKFGVGFKAVFQYTQTPHIYDSGFRFRIERFIVPVEIDDDFPGRAKGDTVFVFPFDHPDRGSEDAYGDIGEKLNSLVFPVLFLSNLERIDYITLEASGTYSKSIDEQHDFEDSAARLITLEHKRRAGRRATPEKGPEKPTKERLWLFTKPDGLGNSFSVGYSLDESGALAPSMHPAFCFFPTRESTGLNFIIHAPFLLTDSREGIKAGELHNRVMIHALADLAADALAHLKDFGAADGRNLITDDIVKIIPYDESMSDIDDRSNISFKPFYTAIKKILQSRCLLPTTEGFASSEHALWLSYPQLAEIFTNSQLAALCGDDEAKWVFAAYGREETHRTNKALAEYIDAITDDWYDQEDVIGLIDGSFIEAQTKSWLHRFYRYVAESKERTKLIKQKPIFLDTEGKAAAAFDEKGQAVLFLPTEDGSGFRTIDQKLLKNKETRELVNALGITEPSLRDEIYNIILPQYESNRKPNAKAHFKKFFRYYKDCLKECPQSEIDDFLKLIRDCKFLRYRTKNDDKARLGKAGELYIGTEELRKYFSAKPDTKFVDIDGYASLIGKGSPEVLLGFLRGIGVMERPRLIERKLSRKEAYAIKDDWSYATYKEKWVETSIDGCEHAIASISPAKSTMLWNHLLAVAACEVPNPEYRLDNKFEKLLYGTYSFFRYRDQQERFESSEAKRLRTEPWLLNTDGEIVCASDLTLQTLSSKYDTDSDAAKELLGFLEIEATVDDDGLGSLPEVLRKEIEFARAAKDAGITMDDLGDFAEFKRLRECQAQPTAPSATRHAQTPPDSGQQGEGIADFPDSPNPRARRIAKEIGERAANVPAGGHQNNTAEQDEAGSGTDEDEYSKPPVDYSRKIEQAKRRSADEIAGIAYEEELVQKALDSKKYSFAWFKALLALESMNSNGNSAGSREISITFGKVEREQGTARTLALKNPSRYIPQSMEDLADIPLELHFQDQPMKKVAIEVVSVKSYTLRVKLKTNAEIDGVDLAHVAEARIVAKNPVFLVEELRKAFERLDHDDDFDMQMNLCPNIEFVFGPPGTGKTTHLAQNVILPLMGNADDLKVLVLTPTNKAADVLVRRIMDVSGEDEGYKDWLVRFGTTNDETIERIGVYRDKAFDIRTFPRNVTVTTIARFPYDYFMPDDGTRLHLGALNWDCIIIDEASMIPVANMAYPLYKKTPQKFIIAGDPFQIEPITTVDLWKNENIYTMVGLDSFANPSTVPHNYPVELLTTQYRSIPEIGEVFSNFAYDGILKHNRADGSQTPMSIDGYYPIKPLNIIKFPVSKYESIYRPKRLQSKSNYQVYSALFAYELVKHFASHIKFPEGHGVLRIGLIAPYRAQSDLIDKLMASINLPSNIDVQAGTIHGFQGDECDIVIALFNPPPSISASKDMFLNKLNIINVSISRARDCLFVIMPDDETENVEGLTLIKKVEKLCKCQPEWTERLAHDIENLIFGSTTYLEDNSFSTSHQLVNVYGEPEQRYEIRSEDNAVDIQIHDGMDKGVV